MRNVVRLDKVIDLLQNWTRTKYVAAGRHLQSILIINNESCVNNSGDYFIRFFTACGTLLEANLVFCTIARPSVYTWHAISSAHVMHGEHHRALHLYRHMRQDGINPNQYIFTCILKACCTARDIVQGRCIHDDIIREYCELHVVFGSALIDMYATCGWPEEACKVFNALPQKDVVTYSALLEGLVQNGSSSSVLKLMEVMQQESIELDKVMFLSALKACEYTGSLVLGKILHNQIIKSGFEIDVIIGNTLIDMYAKCRGLEEARGVFDRLHEPSVVSYGSLISGYANNGLSFWAFEVLERMWNGNTEPNEVIYFSILKACGSIKAKEQGKVVHHHIMKRGMESHISIRCTLIDMYTQCGCLEEACNVFDMLPNKNASLWDAMIAGYIALGYNSATFQLFQQMQQEGISPALETYLYVVKAVDSIDLEWQGRHLHDGIIKDGFETEEAIANTLVDMYANCGSMEDAFKVFNAMQSPSMVTWTSLMGGFVQHDEGLVALKLLEKMQQNGLKPDKVTHLCSLKACVSAGAVLQGRLIHEQIIQSGYEEDVAIGNSLIDMYGKCRCLEEACRVFDRLAFRDLVTWGAMIAGYAQQGNYKLAKLCFEHMQKQGLKPNEVVLTSLLSACCQAGEVTAGNFHFKNMKNHGILPTIELVTCMVDLLGGSGHLREAEQLLVVMSSQGDISSWMSLLTACRVYGNVEIGRRCFDKLVLLDPNIAAGYVLMASIYVSANMWENARIIDKMRKSSRAQKVPGRACIEVMGAVFEFLVEDRSYSWSDYHGKAYIWLRLTKKGGHVPHLDPMA